MVRVDGNVMCKFEVVDSFEDRESLTNGLYTDLLETLLIKAGQYVAGYVVL